MKFYAENESGTAELEIERRPMPEKHFKALVRLAYAVVYAVVQIAALWLVGKIALIGAVGAFVIALILALEEM